ncbi:MAG: hypothetical protein ACRDHK_00855 [Actinomycetota bacterium]
MDGCRKPLAPNIDRNKAPETWITAAPFDTTTVDRNGPRTQPGTIPIRFHVYWAGSDEDGSVAGFYWAVVETLPIPPPGSTALPPLPGPRASDYHYTTRPDSVFIFTVAEDIPDRQHAFFIYSVDDKGKADPTPARFIFNALASQRSLPIPVFDQATARGSVYFFDAGGVLRSETRTFPLTDNRRGFGGAPRETIPSGSRVTFRFRGEVALPGTVVKGFRYKLEESELQPTDPDSLFHGNFLEFGVPAAEADPLRQGRDTVAVSTGTRVFQLRAVNQANGSQDSVRRFELNFSPDTWLAGPDPDVTGSPWRTNAKGEKFALLVGGRLPPGGLPGTLLYRDSVEILPVNRVPRRTFLEIYRDTVFIRREFDTVHKGAWVVFHNGGFDRDSPYSVKVLDGIKNLQPSFPDGPVLRKDRQNGSPIGFRSIVYTYLTKGVPGGPGAEPVSGSVSFTAESRLYPFFDPTQVLDFQRIGGYHPVTRSGRAYSLQRAEDGDGARDRRVLDAQQVAESSGPLRPLVLVFEVNFPPVLKTGDASFRPRVSRLDTLRAPFWNLELPADDVDPFLGNTAGGPVGAPTLRFRFKITGLDVNGAPLVYYDPPRNGLQQTYVNTGSQVNLLAPSDLATGPATLTIELCDCSFCELEAGEGRCISRDIEVYHVALPPPAPTATSSRPGLD